MKKGLSDERVILSKRKIQSDGFMLVYFILLISILIQQFLEAPVSQYIVEMVVWIAMSVYLLICNLVKGNDIYPSKNGKSNSFIILQSVFTGIIIAIITTIQNYFSYGEIVKDTIVFNAIAVGAVSFISASIMTFLVLKLFAYLNDKKQEKINADLNDEE